MSYCANPSYRRQEHGNVHALIHKNPESQIPESGNKTSTKAKVPCYEERRLQTVSLFSLTLKMTVAMWGCI